MSSRAILMLSGTLAAVLVIAAIPARGADPRIVDAAKKEGKLVAYVSMLTENATALLAEFKKKYPFIDTSSGGTVAGVIAACDRVIDRKSVV